MKRKTISAKTRKDILERYGHMCVKCGRKKTLEIHHITLAMNGGKDNYFNLVPLCRECHRFAPDEYIEFLKYLGSRYNPHMNMARTTAFAMCKLFHELPDEDFKEFKSMTPEEFFNKKLEALFDGIKKIIYGYDDQYQDNELIDIKEINEL